MLDSDLVTLHAENRPNDDASTVGGDIDSPDVVIPEGVPNALFPSVAIPIAGGADIVQRYKAFRRNDHATETLANSRYWILNGLKTNTTQGPVTIVTFATETGAVLVAGLVAGVPDSELIDVTGTAGSYVGVKNWDVGEFWWAQAVDGTGSALRTPVGIHEVWRGTKLGSIFPAYDTGDEVHVLSSATAEYDLALDATKNATTTVANRTVDGGLTFLRAVDEATALSGDDLTPGDQQGYWLRRRVRAGLRRPVSYIEPAVIVDGEV